jgi:cytochrome b561
VLHVEAALYHQFVLKDNLLSRMWYKKKTGDQ